MTLKQLKSKADTRLLELWNALAARQEVYRLKNDKYFQLVATATVVDGEDTVLKINHPSDERFKTDVQMSFASPVPFQLIVDEWGNDTEKGFKFTAIVELPDGRRFTRSRSLTDTRTKTQDYDNTGELPVPVGDQYLAGADPVVETTAWSEIINTET